MSSRKIYYTDAEHESELQIFNSADTLFVSLSEKGADWDCKIVQLPKEDAMEIITELARDFGMLDESPDFEGKVLFNECGW